MKKLLCFALSFSIFASIFCSESLASQTKRIDPHDNFGHEHNLYTEFDDGLSGANYLAKVFSVVTSGAAGNAVAECDGNLTRVEAISAAAKIHSMYYLDGYVFPETKPWHASYFDYAQKYMLIKSKEGTLNSAVSRGELAHMLYRAFPRQNTPVLSYILDGSIPDIDVGHPYAEAIYYFCRTGVFDDLDEKGNFHPENAVRREEFYSIISRILIPSLRSGVSLDAHVGSTAPLRPRAGDDFFRDACFIGNSLVDGLSFYSGIDAAAFYSTTGMTVFSVVSEYEFYSPIGTYETAVGAAAAGDYSKVYIELGINEIGMDVSRFKAYYARIIDRLQSSLPEADIYILSLTPVNTSRDSGGIFTRANVNAYNGALKVLAIEKGCYYLDCVTTMVDENGFLSDYDTWDGVHFYEHKYWEWEEIIRTHYVD